MKLDSISLSQKDLQKHLLQIGKDFHRFCMEHNLTYFICGGSLLGAIRHKGFIPWDDDFDVAMPRSDFEKFLDLWERKKEKYSLVSSRDSKYLKLGTPAKLHDDSFRLEEKDEELNGMPKISGYGLFLDIFPLDQYPNTRCGRFLNRYLGRLILGKHLSQYSNRHRSNTQRLGLMLLKLMPKSLIEFVVAQAKLTLQAQTTTNTRWGYGVDVPIFNLWIDGEILFPTEEIEFENTAFKIPANAVGYLEQRYGDYMSLPPESARIPHIMKIYRVIN